jgi:hypothetical protein
MGMQRWRRCAKLKQDGRSLNLLELFTCDDITTRVLFVDINEDCGENRKGCSETNNNKVSYCFAERRFISEETF